MCRDDSGQTLASTLLALAIGFGGAWKVQGWRMGKKLAEQAGPHPAPGG